ncbi:hypothetical protein P4N68_07880 [Corynebacterium felinum]|uniref:Secreted protein n=1 Tax=Corynebacterium felinum TaxID=131318 RepID=A0ABU2B818_9CORY|nr:hypothetical protein [Corynebacterium felinum]MDF5820997.1 hypothetical protein [Corynebacterium felinum]MDR7354743.1 hypothetical protein [Corynebacterium felinum]WJY94106.1 hypothetical protein CFELI_02320 [Corynebacterium felinum]
MELSAKARAIVAAGIAFFVIACVAMVTGSYVSSEASAKEGPLEKTIKVIDASGLTATSVSPYDLFDPEYTMAAVVCPGETRESVAKKFGLDAAHLRGIPTTPVKENYNYLLLGGQLGELKTERIDRDLVDLCNVPTQPFATKAIIPLVKTQTGNWQLAVGE